MIKLIFYRKIFVFFKAFLSNKRLIFCKNFKLENSLQISIIFIFKNIQYILIYFSQNRKILHSV